MSGNGADPWEELQSELDELERGIRRSRAVNVNSVALRERAKVVVQLYFRNARPALVSLGMDGEKLEGIDGGMQSLLRLGNGRNPRASYLRVIRSLKRARPDLELQRELLIGQAAVQAPPVQTARSTVEQSIHQTLTQMIPSAADSYEQAMRDLAEGGRLSYRGTAVELRETLREVLDHLAPDSDVTKADGFQYETGKTRPTMKQKVRFILRSRGIGRTAAGTPEATAERVEATTAALARSTYDRGSLSTHVATSKGEVQQIKLYVDSVLAELLQIHAANGSVAG